MDLGQSLMEKAETAKSYVIKVKPRLAIDREDFGEALVELEKTYLLPTRIMLFAPDKLSTRDYILSRHITNEVIDPAFFKGVEFKPPWKVVRNEQGDERGDGKGGVPAKRGGASKNRAAQGQAAGSKGSAPSRN